MASYLCMILLLPRTSSWLFLCCLDEFLDRGLRCVRPIETSSLKGAPCLVFSCGPVHVSEGGKELQSHTEEGRGQQLGRRDSVQR